MPALSFKRRFVVPIQVGLGQLPRLDDAEHAEYQPKRQTIRAGAPNGQGEAYSQGGRLLARVGAALTLYCGMRTKNCFLIGVGLCTSLHRVLIFPDTMTILVDGKIISAKARTRFVRADGFADLLDMRAFWKSEHPEVEKFNGVLIKWEPV